MIDIMAKNDEKNKKNIDFSSNVNRIEWIDIAKGIGIILVVIGHNFSDGENIIYLRKWIYSFHMPLFFLLSGILFSAKQESFKDFFFKRVRTLLLPYIIFAAISLALFISSYLIVSKINPNIMVDQNKNFINLIFGVFYSKNVNNFLDINIPIWFITCMFIVQLFFFFFKKIIKRDVFIILLALITSVLSYFLFSKIYLPWSIDTALIGVLFFSIGFGIKKYDLINKITRSKLVLVFLSILTFCVTVFISQLNPVVIMAENIYGNYILFLISSDIGMPLLFMDITYSPTTSSTLMVIILYVF